MTSVNEITIKYDGLIAINNFSSLPNLERIIFINYTSNELNSFQLLKNQTKLKYVKYETCTNIKELAEIKDWCNIKKITVEII